MLVISRKTSESIIIGGNIEIIVSDIGTDRVKLCINAPKEINIMRKELLDTCNMNQEAAQSSTLDSSSYALFKALTKSMTHEKMGGKTDE